MLWVKALKCFFLRMVGCCRWLPRCCYSAAKELGCFGWLPGYCSAFSKDAMMFGVVARALLCSF